MALYTVHLNTLAIVLCTMYTTGWVKVNNKIDILKTSDFRFW